MTYMFILAFHNKIYYKFIWVKQKTIILTRLLRPPNGAEKVATVNRWSFPASFYNKYLFPKERLYMSSLTFIERVPLRQI